MCLVKLVYTSRVSYAPRKSMWAPVSDHWSEMLPYAHSVPSLNSSLRKLDWNSVGIIWSVGKTSEPFIRHSLPD